MALTAPRDTTWIRTRLGDTLRIPMAAGAVIFQGGMVCVDEDGYAVAAADTADYKFGGIAVEDPQNPARSTYDNSGGDDGDMEVVVWIGRYRMTLALRTPTQDMLFAKVYVYDDDHVAVHKFDVANDLRCGHIVRCPTAALAAHPSLDMAADEVEVEASGEPFDWDGGVTTSTTTEQGL